MPRVEAAGRVSFLACYSSFCILIKISYLLFSGTFKPERKAESEKTAL
jgi:hypothetical protein